MRLVESELAAWALDWLDGPVLRDRRGAAVPVHDIAASIAETGDAARLAQWLAAR